MINCTCGEPPTPPTMKVEKRDFHDFHGKATKKIGLAATMIAAVAATAIITSLIVNISLADSSTPDATSKLVSEGRLLTQGFFKKLKRELVQALRTDGAVDAIKVCNLVSPTIVFNMSERTGWEVGRTSLKARNPANKPDRWERGVLEMFDTRLANGDLPKELEHYAVLMEDGKSVFRYMKAIPTAEKPCLICHGEAIKPEILSVLNEIYPDDQARGYHAGELRGAFTFRRPLD